MKLHVSDDLVLSADFVTATAGIFATKGQGKSHLAQVIAEEMLEAGQVIVVIDPTDVWSGLRSSADGRGDGYPILVIGGDHGDLKLEPEVGAGTRLAEAIVADRFSCVICTDGIDDTLAIRYVREVLQTLFRKNREPIHLFVDEADIFAPQVSKEEEDHRCTRALSHVVRRGRRKGIGSTLITQRPSELNASVRSQVEMLFVLGMIHNLDIDAVEKWLRLRKKKRGANAAFALQEEMIESLDTLQRGDAWVWAPRLKIHQRFRARAKRTFDSGATPKAGQKTRAAKRLAPVDIQRLGTAIAEAAKRQKENDPAELRRQVVALRKELDRVGKGQDRAEENEKANHAENLELRTKIAQLKEVPSIKKADLDRLEKIVARAETALTKHDQAVARQYQAFGDLVEGYAKSSKAVTSAAIVAIDDLRAKIKPAPSPPPGYTLSLMKLPVKTNGSHVARTETPRHESDAPLKAKAAEELFGTRAPARADERRVVAQDPSLKPAHFRLLSAIAWWEAVGVPEPDLVGVAFAAGTSSSSSAFENNRSRLRAAGYIEYPSSGRVRLTDAGRALAPSPQLPPTNVAIQDAVLSRVTPAVGRLLRVLIEHYPQELALEDLATGAGTTSTSSAFENNRSWLRARGLAHYPRTGFVAATKLLFPEGS